MRFLCAVWLLSGLLFQVRAREFTVLVYNLENFTSAEGRTRSEDYRPLVYTRIHLLTKMNNIARVAAQFNDGAGPDIILFQEIERDISTSQYGFDHIGMLRHYRDTEIEYMLGKNFDREVAALPVEALLLKTFEDRGLTGYRVAAADDGMIAGPKHSVGFLNVVFTRFPIRLSQTYPMPDAPAVLEVQVKVDGWPLHLFVNHWPEGVEDIKAEQRRIKIAETVRARLDEILEDEPAADIIVAGDFNCLYDQKARFHWSETAINDTLRVLSYKAVLRSKRNALYNLWGDLPAEERGSELYNGQWTTFMQMMVSAGLYDYRGIQIVDRSFRVASFPGLNTKPNGAPFGWSFHGPGAGFSVHFPISATFKTVKENRTDMFLKITEPPRSITPSADQRLTPKK